jgi:stage IV sporulation protein A
MIKVNIATEIAPIVGSEEQAQDLINYINNSTKAGDVWNASIFGKSMGQLIEDEIQGKILKLTDESQIKLQDTMQKVVNDSNGGLVCLII